METDRVIAVCAECRNQITEGTITHRNHSDYNGKLVVICSEKCSVAWSTRLKEDIEFIGNGEDFSSII